MADEKETAAGAATAEQESALEGALRQVREKRDETIAYSVVEEKSLNNSMKDVVIEIPWEPWNERIESQFKEWQKSAQIEGFRKGKAPVKLLKRRFMAEAQEDMLQKLVPNIVREYEQKNSLTIYGTPAIKQYKIDEDQPVRVTLELEVKPELDPTNYKGIEVEVPAYKSSKEMVDHRLDHLRRDNATFVEVDKAYEAGAALVVDVKVLDSRGQTVDQQINQLLERPATALPEKVHAEVIGKKAGDTVETRVANPKKAGEALRYTVAIKAVKELKLPELDDDFAKDIGSESLEALRKSVETDEQAFVDRLNREEALELIVAKLVEAHDFAVPPALQAQVEQDLARSDMQYMYSGQMPQRLQGASKSEYREKLQKDAIHRVKGFLLLDAIAKKENIQASEDDINNALEERGKREGRKGVAIRAALEKRRQLDQFIEQVRFNNVSAFLLENSKVKYVDRPEPAPHSHDHDHEDEA
ncbi:MAG: trigger factor [Candidatus Sumerlaeaceae bacterium]|nr:trigger factor [Candidatus Sumerlaeaceae bacterium]